ncbi:MAG: hypothetical protein DRR08_05380 [Candidatus Parabeggiatoa sp. nov. 2]|nr:MAG: hypothetical protein B6247_18880 [Beggiatoa sp. 4572_84]RKZ62721.1 MAG: hypothetical protein DRR08_05380 [Gammaproteobacteria bacterium]
MRVEYDLKTLKVKRRGILPSLQGQHDAKVKESNNILKERAKRADIGACRAVLAKVPDNPPIDELDKI